MRMNRCGMRKYFNRVVRERKLINMDWVLEITIGNRKKDEY